MKGRSVEIAREWPGLRVRLWVTAAPSTVKAYRADLDLLWQTGRTDWLDALANRTVDLPTVHAKLGDALRSRVPLPKYERHGALGPELRAWLDGFKPYKAPGRGKDNHDAYVAAVFGSEQERYIALRQSRGAKVLMDYAPANATADDLPQMLREMRMDRQRLGHFNTYRNAKNAASAFAKEKLGRNHPIYFAIRAVEGLPRTAPDDYRAPTLPDLLTFLVRLNAIHELYGRCAFTMALHGMGPREMWGRWEPEGAGLHIYGTKRPSRNRLVPLIGEPERPAFSIHQFRRAMTKAAVGLDRGWQPYDLRRCYSHILGELHNEIDVSRAERYMGHRAGIRDIYRLAEARKYLVPDGAAIRATLAAAMAQLGAGPLALLGRGE